MRESVGSLSRSSSLSSIADVDDAYGSAGIDKGSKGVPKASAEVAPSVSTEQILRVTTPRARQLSFSAAMQTPEGPAASADFHTPMSVWSVNPAASGQADQFFTPACGTSVGKPDPPSALALARGPTESNSPGLPVRTPLAVMMLGEGAPPGKGEGSEQLVRLSTALAAAKDRGCNPGADAEASSSSSKPSAATAEPRWVRALPVMPGSPMSIDEIELRVGSEEPQEEEEEELSLQQMAHGAGSSGTARATAAAALEGSGEEEEVEQRVPSLQQGQVEEGGEENEEGEQECEEFAAMEVDGAASPAPQEAVPASPPSAPVSASAPESTPQEHQHQHQQQEQLSQEAELQPVAAPAAAPAPEGKPAAKTPTPSARAAAVAAIGRLQVPPSPEEDSSFCSDGEDAAVEAMLAALVSAQEQQQQLLASPTRYVASARGHPARAPGAVAGVHAGASVGGGSHRKAASGRAAGEVIRSPEQLKVVQDAAKRTVIAAARCAIRMCAVRECIRENGRLREKNKRDGCSPGIASWLVTSSLMPPLTQVLVCGRQREEGGCGAELRAARRPRPRSGPLGGPIAGLLGRPAAPAGSRLCRPRRGPRGTPAHRHHRHHHNDRVRGLCCGDAAAAPLCQAPAPRRRGWSRSCGLRSQVRRSLRRPGDRAPLGR
jgi:hypothetical protein